MFPKRQEKAVFFNEIKNSFLAILITANKEIPNYNLDKRVLFHQKMTVFYLADKKFRACFNGWKHREEIKVATLLRKRAAGWDAAYLSISRGRLRDNLRANLLGEVARG